METNKNHITFALNDIVKRFNLRDLLSVQIM